jgi:hypothetical protein
MSSCQSGVRAVGCRLATRHSDRKLGATDTTPQLLVFASERADLSDARSIASRLGRSFKLHPVTANDIGDHAGETRRPVADVVLVAGARNKRPLDCPPCGL